MIYTLAQNLLNQLRRCGVPDDVRAAIAVEIATSDNPQAVCRSYEQDFAPQLLSLDNTCPFEDADPGVVDGELRFALSQKKYPAGLDVDDVHTVIAGSSKTGKSVAVDIINNEALSKGHKAWMFIKTDDSTRLVRKHRDVLYVDFPNSWLKLNPLLFLPEGIFISIFKYSFALFEGSEAYLADSLAELKARNDNPALLDLFYFIRAQKLPVFSRTARHQESVLGRLKEIVASPLNEIYNCRKGHEEDLINTSVIFNIFPLPLALQKFFVCSMLELLYLHNLEI